MSSIIQNQKIKFNQKNNSLFGLNPAVVKARLTQCSKQVLVEQALLISQTLAEHGLSPNERQCLIHLYKFCKNQYKTKYQKS